MPAVCATWSVAWTPPHKPSTVHCIRFARVSRPPSALVEKIPATPLLDVASKGTVVPKKFATDLSVSPGAVT